MIDKTRRRLRATFALSSGPHPSCPHVSKVGKYAQNEENSYEGTHKITNIVVILATLILDENDLRVLPRYGVVRRSEVQSDVHLATPSKPHRLTAFQAP